jgi:sugar lactone lactonase YvrE
MKTEQGWKRHSTTGSRALAGANGMQIGPDGRLHVVSAFGGELIAIDVDSGARETLAAPGGALSSPDDLAFSASGALFVSECMDARVSELRDGKARVVADGLPGANGIATLGERLFVNECRPAGRMFEVFPDGREPRLLADGLELPNGMCAGPDGFLYFVLVFSGKVARMPVDGGPVEIFAEGLAAPSSTRWGPDGKVWVSQGGNGEVVRIDPRDGSREVVAHARPGIDNLAISPDGRLFVSFYIDGEVLELTGAEQRPLLPRGLLGPYGVASAAGVALVADGMELVKAGEEGVEVLGKYTDPGYPGYLCGIAVAADGAIVTTSAGALCRFDPAAESSTVLAEGLSEPRGVALGADGEILVVESATGRLLAVARSAEPRASGQDPAGPAGFRVLASGLDRPADVALAPDGTAWVSEEGAGALVAIGEDGEVVTRIEGLASPQGIAVDGDTVYAIEVGSRTLRAWNRDGEATPVASDLPVGLDGASRPTLGGLPELIPGPVAPLAGLAAEPGRLYVGCDAEGFVMVLASE